MIRRPKQEKPVDYNTRVCLSQSKFKASLKVPSIQALAHLRKLIQLRDGETKTCQEEFEEQKVNNHALIKQLRSEIMAKRLDALCPGRNDMLMRSALIGHHDGSKIFTEKEPRDVNEQTDFQTSDLRNKLNALKHALQTKKNQLNSMLVVFNDTVEDFAFLELEGPMGDSRCLALENHISDVGKRTLEVEILQHTLKHIRDQLVLERLTNNTSIKTMEKLLKGSHGELVAMQQCLEDSQQRRTNAIANTLRTEVDNQAKRKKRTHILTHCKKLNDDQKHEFFHLRKAIQAFFTYQDSVPLRNAISGQHRQDSQDLDNMNGFALGELQDMELDTTLLREVTGSRDVRGVVQCFETQRDTFEHLQSLVKEMEVKKAELLRRAEHFAVTRNAAVFHDQSATDSVLRRVGEERRDSDAAAAESRWSALAATNRVTQALARLRQLLEYLVTSLARASLLPEPPQAGTETGPYLTEMLRLAGEGVAQLMERLEGEDPEEALRRAAHAKFALTRSETKFSTRPPPTLALSHATDDGDTTGDDVQMASRVAMKRQAHLIVQAKLKAGYGKKKW